MTTPEPGRRRLQPRRAIVSVLTTSIATIFGILVLEAGLRFTDYRYLLGTTRYPDEYFRKDPELGADHTPNSANGNFTMRGPGFDVFTNSLGCFDRDEEIKAGYILAVGDSATWGFVPASKNWTHLMQSLTGRQVLNCGVSGVGTRFAMLKAKRTIDQIGFAPSLIVLLYVNNDLNDDYVFPSYTVLSGQRFDRVRSIDLRTGKLSRSSEEELDGAYRSYRIHEASLKQKLRNNSLTAWLLFRLLIEPRRVDGAPSEPIIDGRYGVMFWNLQPEQYPWLAGAVADHLESFRAFHEMATDYGTRLVVFDEGPGPDEAAPHRIRFIERLREELNFVYPLTFEAVDRQEGRRLRHKFDSHWNALGNERAAEEMLKRLREAGLLGRP